MTESNDTQAESKHTSEVATFVAGGGALTSGLAVAGTTAIGVGLLPVAALGMVVGLAAYGVKRALFDDVKSSHSTAEVVDTQTVPMIGQVDSTADTSQISAD
jgi:hypothetical protein